MRIRYDPEVDALSIIFREATVTTAELVEGITAEYGTAGRLVGIEVLDTIQRFGDPSVLQQITLEGLGAAIAPGLSAASTRPAVPRMPAA